MKRGREAAAAASSSGYPARSEGDEASVRRVLEEQTLLRLSREGPVNPDTKAFCGAFASLELDNSWDLAKFQGGFSIEITKLSDELVEFDMIGIDPPLANAFRRILIAEVPTVAISQATIYQNTSVIHDENLAHRLGLVPLKFEPDNLEWRPAESEFNERNSIRFSLHVVCQQGKKAVYSRDLKWKPWSETQQALFKDDPPRPVADDILIAQLRSGQEIECELFCEKGVGREHAKWSPVCTAYYRLQPVIKLTKDIVGEDAEHLKAACPMGVFDIEDLGKKGKKAFVANARVCTTCRECLETFNGEEKGVVLGKEKQHFLFSIESVGQILAAELFRKALIKFQEKVETALGVLESRSSGEPPA